MRRPRPTAVLATTCALHLFALAAFAGPPPKGRVTTGPKAAMKGGMGKVYQATDESGQRFAVKFNEHDDFTRSEALTAVQIGAHHGWPEHHATWSFDGAFNGRPGNVMDWVDGGSLHSLVNLDRPKAVRIVRRGLRHLRELHLRGWVHADVKPDNLMIDRERRSQSTMLVDFGLAIPIGQRGSARRGTAEYMAPEQWSDGPRTAATDVFGAAGTLFYLLTGDEPFPAARALVNRSAIADDPSVRALYLDPPLRRIAEPAVREVLKRALAPDPGDRYPSAEAFREALAPLVR